MFRMDDDRARFIDATCKILALLGIAIGSTWTVYTYFLARGQEAQTTAIEARKPFEAERLQLYVDAATSAAIIATSDDAGEVKKAKDRFWTLYWGPLAVVEDKPVETAMVLFGRCIQNTKDCDQAPQILALQLAHNCRDSVAQGWDVALSKSEINLRELEQLRR